MDTIQEFFTREKTWFGMWLEYDRNKFTGDSNFMDVLDYVKNNNISMVKNRKLL